MTDGGSYLTMRTTGSPQRHVHMNRTPKHLDNSAKLRSMWGLKRRLLAFLQPAVNQFDATAVNLHGYNF